MTDHIPVSGHQLFHFFRYFLKWKQLFRIVETYFSIFFTWLVQTNFLPSGNSIFRECYFTASRNHYWNKEKKVLRERDHCCYWTTDFLANGNHFFSPFFRNSCQGQFIFRLVEVSFSTKSFITTSENGFILFRGFPSSENHYLNYWKPLFKERLCFNQCN